MGKPKQHTKPPKKSKHKQAEPETADDFQEAADREEDTGSKWRAGDSAKSGRAFVRALEVYDKGLQKHPANFDLAYNKARLLLEITQQPALVEHIGLPLIDLLAKTLEAHRYALKLSEENPDALFNTAQVLTSLAEQLSEAGQPHHAIPLLQESLELLSSCLSRQEMLLEQQQQDFEDMDEGGVQLDPEERPASTSASDVSEQTALVETPITANDLLDTVHASLSSLTTLVPMVEQSALQTYGDMAQTLTEKRALHYVSLLPPDLQDAARFKVALDRAIFIAAFADAQYSFMAIDLATYLQQLGAFEEIPAKEQSAHALSSEAEARTEFVLSAIENFQGSPESPAQLCWKQLSLAQDIYTVVTKIETEEAKERKAHTYESKGNIELLRHRLASTQGTPLSESIQRSAKTLIQNAQTYFKGAAQLARADEDSELEVKAKQRWLIATDIAAAMYGVEAGKDAPFHGNSENARGDIVQAISDVIEEGLIEMSLGEEIMRRVRA